MIKIAQIKPKENSKPKKTEEIIAVNTIEIVREKT